MQGKGRLRPLVHQILEWVLLRLERVRIAWSYLGIILGGIDELATLFCILFREQPLHRLNRFKRRIAEVKIAIRESEILRLVDCMNIVRRVVAHTLQVKVLKDIQRL